jgi:hypothetical protein
LSNVRKPINVGEMTQTLYAHMNKRNKKTNKCDYPQTQNKGEKYLIKVKDMPLFSK